MASSPVAHEVHCQIRKRRNGNPWLSTEHFEVHAFVVMFSCPGKSILVLKIADGRMCCMLLSHGDVKAPLVGGCPPVRI